MDTNIEVCRICLISGVKMFHIDDVLENYISLLVNDESYTKYPNYICYECVSLLMKFIKFRKKYIKAQSILSNIVKECGEIKGDNIKGIHQSTIELKSHLGYQKLFLICLSNTLNNEVVKSHEKTTSDCGTNLEVYIKPDIETDSDHEVDALYEEEIEIDTKPEVEDNKLDNKVGLAENAGINLAKVKKSAQKDQFTDDLPFGIIVKNQTEVKTGDQQIKSKGVQKFKCGTTRKRRAAPNKTVHREPKLTKRTDKALNTNNELNKYFTIVKLSMEEQMKEFNERKQSSNYLNAPFQCNLCYRGFVHTHAWKLHMLKHDPSAGDIKCPICKIRVKAKHLLNIHIKSHEVKYICKSCSHVCMYKYLALRHHRWHAGVTYKCPHCDLVCTKWTSYMSHVRIKHPSQFICNECGYSFVSKLGLAMHKKRIHQGVEKADGEAEPGPYCKECDVKFVSVEAWNQHMIISDKHKQTAHFENLCRVCGKTFKNSEELRVHHQTEHAAKYKVYNTYRPPATWPAKCEHCSEEISNTRQKWLHYQKNHPNEMYPHKRKYEYTCDICGKKCFCNAALISHKRTHSEERPFICGTCGKAFYNASNLRRHETQTHSDLRPFPCSLCGKAFKCKGALSKHTRRHEGIKPYPCELCGKSFAESSGRKLHVNTVHLKQPAPPRAPRRRPPTARDSTHDTT